MKLLSYALKNKPSEVRVGLMQDGGVYALENWQGDMRELIAYGLQPKRTGKKIALDEVIIRAPLRPGKMIGVGRNYAAHAAELDNEVPGEPLLFAKWPTSIIGEGQTITWSQSLTQQVDWEGELAVIIGSTGWNIPEDQALSYVFGYTVANDVSARDLQDHDDQWVRAKGLDTFAPMGPWIVTADEIPDPHNLHIQTLVNGEVMQDSTTSLMIYRIPHLIAFCSRAFTLEPGDIILTGTPAGVGKGRKPPVFLKDGDVVTVKIDGIGEISNPCSPLE